MFASGNLPVELLHSISTDATTNGATSSLATGLRVVQSLQNKSISTFARCERMHLSPVSSHPVDWIPVRCIRRSTGSRFDSYTLTFLTPKILKSSGVLSRGLLKNESVRRRACRFLKLIFINGNSSLF